MHKMAEALYLKKNTPNFHHPLTYHSPFSPLLPLLAKPLPPPLPVLPPLVLPAPPPADPMLDEDLDRRLLDPPAGCSLGLSNQACASSCRIDGRFCGHFSSVWEVTHGYIRSGTHRLG